MVETAVTPAIVAVAAGKDAPEGGSSTEQQWAMWIADALMLIEERITTITPPPTLPQAKVDYVVRSAVVAMVRRPDDATQVTMSVDDGSTSRTYSRGGGEVTIKDEWWQLLGLVPEHGRAYSVDTAPSRPTLHRDVCALVFGARYCSCGGDLAGHPLWEGS